MIFHGHHYRNMLYVRIPVLLLTVAGNTQSPSCTALACVGRRRSMIVRIFGGRGTLMFYKDLYHFEINHSSGGGHIFSCKIDQGIYLLAFKGYVTDRGSATAGITDDVAGSHRCKRIVW